MDHFGIGQAMRGMAQVYFHQSRRTGRTGRTTSLVESLKDGDRVVFVDAHQAKEMQRLCKERNLQVDCIVVNIRDTHRLIEKCTPQGRLIFDHMWVEKYYEYAIESSANDIDHWQRELSGFGTAHYETRRKAEELARWRY